MLGMFQDQGAGGVFLLMFIENLVPPIPSEVIMPLAGWAAASEGLSLLEVVVAGCAGSLLGTLPWYWLGRRVGHKRLRDWAERHGGWLGTDGEDIDRADAWFARRGGSAILIGRLIPGVRTLVSIPAGVAAMPLGRYLLASGVGIAIWVTALALLGRFLGPQAEQVAHWMAPVGNVLFALFIGAWIVRAVRRRRRKRGAAQGTHGSG